MATLSKKQQRVTRHKRVRAKIKGTTERPRLAVFRSNRFVYAQLIDDTKGVTIAAASSKDMKGGIREVARKVGSTVGAAAKAKGITAAVFDRGGFSYAGTIKELAEGAREGGLAF
jgi:large subunit ribosomal protein L18